MKKLLLFLLPILFLLPLQSKALTFPLVSYYREPVGHIILTDNIFFDAFIDRDQCLLDSWQLVFVNNVTGEQTYNIDTEDTSCLSDELNFEWKNPPPGSYNVYYADCELESGHNKCFIVGGVQDTFTVMSATDIYYQKFGDLNLAQYNIFQVILGFLVIVSFPLVVILGLFWLFKHMTNIRFK